MDMIHARLSKKHLTYPDITSHIDLRFLLRTNDSPTEAEARQIAATLADAEKQLAEILVVMSRPSHADNLDLKSKRFKLFKLIIDHRNALKAVRRVPNELLMEIFFQSTTSRLGDQNVNVFGSGFPKTLLRVCSRWRAVALHCTALWSSIEVDMNTKCLTKPAKRRVALQTLEDWLARGKTYPLSVIFKAAPKKCALSLQIFKCIVAQSWRWKNVKLTIPAAYHLELAGIYGRLPLLERLTFVAVGPLSEPLNEFHEAPLLRSVSLDIKYEGEGYRYLAMPWSQLTYYHDKHHRKEPVAARSLDFLWQMTNVEECYLNTTYLGDPKRVYPISSAHLLQVDLPKLRKLSYRVMLHEANQILDRLTLPGLEDLTLHPGTDACAPKHLIRLLDRSHCFLRKLDISAVYLRGDEIFGILLVAPALVELDIRIDRDSAPRVFDALTYKGIHEGLFCRLPDLKILGVEVGKANYIFRDPMFCDMVLSRSKLLQKNEMIANLQVMHLRTSAPVERMILQHLRTLSEVDVDIRVYERRSKVWDSENSYIG